MLICNDAVCGGMGLDCIGKVPMYGCIYKYNAVNSLIGGMINNALI